MPEHNGDWKEWLSKLGLFGFITALVIGSVVFSYVYGIMQDSEAAYVESAGEVVRTGSIAIIGAVVALLTRNGGDE